MSLDEADLNFVSSVVRRPSWPAGVPAFAGAEAATVADPTPGGVFDALSRAGAARWTCRLSPDRFHAWRSHGDRRGRTLIVSAIDADVAVPLQLYWMLSRAPSFAAVLSALRVAMTGVAGVIFAVPDDVPSRWRGACSGLEPRRVAPDYPVGNWRLLPHVLGVDPRRALVLDVVATIDLAGPSPTTRPIAVVEDGEVQYRVAPADAFVRDLAPRDPTFAADEPIDRIVGPLLRARRAGHDERVGDADLTFHLAPRVGVERSPCVRCGWCVRVCPTKCDPVALMRLSLGGERVTPLRLRHVGLDSCIDCGLCTAVCPSRLPLHGYIDALRTEVEAQRNDVVFGGGAHR